MSQSINRFYFPPISAADENGLLLLGGELTPAILLEAYRLGIFPWPIVNQNLELLAWFSPDPRAVIELNQFRVSRRLARRIRSGIYNVTIDTAFEQVIRGCARPRNGENGVWITEKLVKAYCQMYDFGHAHSVEVWHENELVGGLYGIAIGGVFAGESMFHRMRDASKVAMTYLVDHLKHRGYQLFAIQQSTSHSVRLGATELMRGEFLRRLKKATGASVTFGDQLETSLPSAT